MMFPSDGRDPYPVLFGIEIDPAASDNELDELEGALRRANAPAHNNDLLRELTRLKFLTKSRQQNDVDTKLQLQAYLTELSRYPGEITLYAVSNWITVPDKGAWFPSFEELFATIKPYLQERTLLAGGIQRARRRQLGHTDTRAGAPKQIGAVLPTVKPAAQASDTTN